MRPRSAETALTAFPTLLELAEALHIDCSRRIGTIVGGGEAMVNGGVDENRASEHQSQWFEKYIAKGRAAELPASEGRPAPAE
jgi:hypothetical protein